MPTPYCVMLIRTVPKLMIAAGTKSWSDHVIRTLGSSNKAVETHRFCWMNERCAKGVRINVEACANHNDVKDEENHVQEEENCSKGVKMWYPKRLWYRVAIHG